MIMLRGVIKEVEEGHGQTVMVESIVVRIVFLAVIAVADGHEEPSLPPTTVLHEQVVVQRLAITLAIAPCVVPYPRIFQAIVSQLVFEVGKFRYLMDLVIELVVRNWDLLPIVGHLITNEVPV